MRIINIGTYLPKQCGIATFSSDIYSSLTALGHSVEVIAVSDEAYSYVYPPEVVFEIRQQEKQDYLMAADWINQQEPDVVLIQHEYGIYGGECGEHILELAQKLMIPYFVTAHTVLASPSWKQQFILWQLASRARQIILMNRQAQTLLHTHYGIPEEKLTFIPHGVPVFEKKNATLLKQQYGFPEKKIISTFGLIGPGKGLEMGINAFYLTAQEHPDACYLILGQTHPMLQHTEGEVYRQRLEDLTEQLNISEQVRFVNHFLTTEELGDYLYMTDVYFSPYPELQQSVSGTMAFAIGCGRAIVSTPYAFAVENLSDGRGLLSQNVSAIELSELLSRILSDPLLKEQLQNQAYQLGQSWSWPEVGRQYVQCFEKAFQFPYSPVEGAYSIYAEL